MQNVLVCTRVSFSVKFHLHQPINSLGGTCVSAILLAMARLGIVSTGSLFCVYI